MGQRDGLEGMSGTEKRFEWSEWGVGGMEQRFGRTERKLGCIMEMGFEWSGSDEEVDSPAEFVQLY